MKKLPFTVIGFFDETGDIFIDHVTAPNALSAIGQSARKRENQDTVYVCALRGELTEGVDLDCAGQGIVYGSTVISQPDVFPIS